MKLMWKKGYFHAHNLFSDSTNNLNVENNFNLTSMDLQIIWGIIVLISEELTRISIAKLI